MNFLGLDPRNFIFCWKNEICGPQVTPLLVGGDIGQGGESESESPDPGPPHRIGGDGGRMKMFFERLKQIVKPFILRRRKVDVLHELVKKEQHVLQVDLGDGQQVAVNVRVAL